MINIQRFILFIEEFFLADVKHYYHFIGEQEEHVFLLEDNLEIKVTEPRIIGGK